MARVIFGQGVTRMAGSIGGTTFSRNRFGAYAKNKALPVNPDTPLQQVIKTLMQNLTALWISLLTPVQRFAWAEYGSRVAVTDRFGETVFLTGINHYVRSNLPRMQAGLARIDDGPTDYALPATDPTISLIPTASDDGLSLTFDATMDWANETGAALILWGGKPRSISRIFFNGPYRLAGDVLGDDAIPPTSPEALTSAYVLTEGQLIKVQCRIVRADGRISDPFRVSGLVIA